MKTHFIDSIEITLASGKGGAGSASFRREKYVPMGGPDGGDGGKGGDVIIQSTSHERTLRKLRLREYYVAENGHIGQRRKRHGADGKDLIIEVPYGTVIKTLAGIELVRFGNEIKQFCLLKGGKGGRGNVHFKNSVRQAPQYAQSGQEGSQLSIQVELELATDICFIGAPNVGKSTLLKVLTNADPKIANYPFTTLIPNLGTLRNIHSEVILADIPGILSGAAKGYGLGTKFLRHIRKVNVICYVLDISSFGDTTENSKETIQDIASKLFNELTMLREEVIQYDSSFIEKPFLVVCNKIDLLMTMSKEVIHILNQKLQKMEQKPIEEAIMISASHFIGIDTLKAILLNIDNT